MLCILVCPKQTDINSYLVTDIFDVKGTSMADQDSISFLKRKIIGVDKLVKDKNKTETKNADLTETIELTSTKFVHSCVS